MWDTIKTFIPRAVQDLVTAAASIMAAHGYLSADDQQKFIGSAFFLSMLVVNYFIAQSRKATAAQAGAAVALGVDASTIPLAPATARAIAKGTPQ